MTDAPRPIQGAKKLKNISLLREEIRRMFGWLHVPKPHHFLACKPGSIE